MSSLISHTNLQNKNKTINVKSSYQYNTEHVPNVTLFKWRVSTFGNLCLFIPTTTLFTCLIFAMKYQFDEVNEHKCNVTNLLPSISAITGVYPQCYAWRIVMAFQCMPRLAIGFSYTRLWCNFTPRVSLKNRKAYTMLYQTCLFLYVIELCMAVGTAFISNKDNYPIHEKLFVVFLMAGVAYQLFTLVLFRLVHRDFKRSDPQDRRSYKMKFVCYIVMCISIALLLASFYMHRVHCDPSAFSVFAGMEYIIAVSNMVYHYTGVYDLRGMYFAICSEPPSGSSSKDPPICELASPPSDDALPRRKLD